MAVDVVPELNDKITAAFRSRLMRNRRLPAISRMIEAGTATLDEAHEFSAIVGEAASGALKSVLVEENLPNGTLYRNIAERTVTPLLEETYTLVNDEAVQIQQLLDTAENIGLGSVRADFPRDRIADLIDKISEDLDIEIARRWLGEPIVNNSEAFFDDYVKANASFRQRSGMESRIIRKAESGACKWCRALAGSWEYGDEPREVYARHEFCRCSTTYVANRRAQSVWSKKEWELPKEQLSIMRQTRAPDEMTKEERAEVIAQREKDAQAVIDRREYLKKRRELFLRR